MAVAYACAVGDASVKLCDGQKDDPIEIEDSFEAVAFAVAKATADATVACYASAAQHPSGYVLQPHRVTQRFPVRRLLA